MSIDWDVATAAALADESEVMPSTPHPLPTTSPDRLLQDLIREIVGDAAADTVSPLQPEQHTVERESPRIQEAAPPERIPLPDDEIPSSTLTSPASEQGSPSESLDAPEPSQVNPNNADDSTAEALRAEEIGSERFHPTLAVDGNSTEPTHDPVADPSLSSSTTPGTLDRRDVLDEEPHEAQTLVDRPTFPTIDIPPSVSRETDEHQLATSVSRETATPYGGTPLADQLADETRRRQALEDAVLPLPTHTRIMTISNQKGGVGKTTTAVNLAAALARTGAHVLVIDLDPQGNASTALGVDHRSERQSVYEVLVADLPLADVVQPSTEHERLDCVPATIHLAGAEIELVSLVAREQRLRRALDAHIAGMARPYDYVFIDCPPSLGLLTINAFVAAREVLIPIQCEYYALEGLSQLLSNIELIEKHLNPDLRLSTILLTMYDSRTNLAQQVAQEVRDHFPTQTLETIIPRSVRVSEAPSYGQSVISYDFASTGSLSYREAAAEIAKRDAAQKDTH